ncbi:hypothetical protein [Streptomyces sp. NPDC048445]|uniref:hypothetical protein n=1 Tax=Streptomyces sp. NPDC048445 TaxID=3365553 RepID=UPI0037145ADF
MTECLPSDVVEARLNHLIDRARRGALLPEEADRFTTELRDLVRRLEDTEDAVDRVRALCDRYQTWHEGGWAPADAALVAREYRDALDQAQQPTTTEAIK